MATTLAPRWTIGSRDRAAASKLERELGIPSLVAGLLVQRGYTDPWLADRFLNPSLDNLHDPRLLPDYEPAVKAILGARERKDLIFVHGDYDVDGVTSAALLDRFLKKIDCVVHTHVPHRIKEGYGINRSAVQEAIERGAKLFLTCDCGIAAHEQVALARAAGMQVVVTDHHPVAGNLPDADAVINPHRPDSKYPFAELSGVGVAYKLCQGLCRELEWPLAGFHRAFLDLAALGTIADVMPLRDENRIIARFGLERIGDSQKVGIRALIRESGLKIEPGKGVRCRDVSFQLGPRINAAGRIEDAALALELLLERDQESADRLAKEIEGINTNRRTEQDRVVIEAIAMVTERGLESRNVIVVAGENWHSGILGIAAGRLVEAFHRPTFVLAIDRERGSCHGSGRSIRRLDIGEFIRGNVGGLLLGGGGHAMAAGCSVALDRLDEMADAMHAYAGTVLTEEDFIPEVRADFEVDFSELTLRSVEAMASMEPFGTDNPEPVFVARGISLAQLLPTRNPAHMQLMLRQGTSSAIKGIAFGIGERLAATGAGVNADLLFCATIDEYRGSRSLKLQVKDYTA